MIIMKKYIYTLLCALLFAVGCNNDGSYTPDVAFYFGKVNTETTEFGATVELLAYMTVDGKLCDDADIYLQYWKSGDTTDVTEVRDYVDGDELNKRIFTISDLESDTLYLTYVIIDGGDKYGIQREIFSFTTKRYDHINCSVDVDAYGVTADVNLSNLKYICGSKSQQISSVKIEYTPKGMNAWTAVEINGNHIKNDSLSISIPEEGGKLLEENSAYSLRVTLVPADVNLPSLATDNIDFNTTYAKITADIAKPQLSYDDDGITIKARKIDVYYDGISSENYTAKVLFRAQGSNLWDEYDVVEYQTIQIPIEQLSANTNYEAKISIVAGAKNQVRESDIVVIEPPVSNVPILPEPPTGGDTSAIEGVWHLTSWRGAEPSFDVYMDITATGGITLYQRIDSRYWDVYQSTAFVENGIISGVYTDNVAWGTSYNLVVDGDTMTWTSIADAEDISIYTRSTLPTNMPTAPTRAAAPAERFL